MVSRRHCTSYPQLFTSVQGSASVAENRNCLFLIIYVYDIGYMISNFNTNTSSIVIGFSLLNNISILDTPGIQFTLYVNVFYVFLFVCDNHTTWLLEMLFVVEY